MDTRDGFDDRYRLHAGEDVLDERAASRADRSLRAVDAMKKFADRDDADRPFFVSE